MEPTAVLLSVLKQNWWLLPILLFLLFARSAAFKGYCGELLVRLLIHFAFDKQTWHRLHNVTIPSVDGTTQIDHILLSPFGVFVIETKNIRGWIFGNADQPYWTQKIYRNSFKFQNPLRQNFKHLKALELILDVPLDQMHSVIVFVGDSTFKTPMPANVTYCMDAIRYIRSFKEVIYTQAQLEELLQKLQQEKFASTYATHQAHVSTLKKRSDINASRLCPKCGSSLVIRTVKSGHKAGSQFWGCSTYPKCKVMQDIV